MKISMLLAIHQRLVQDARLANLACAYATLRCFAVRVHRARLHGAVTLCQPDATRGRNWAELTALEGSQAQIEELFTDEDIMELADSIAFARGVAGLEIGFRIEEIDAEFVRPIEAALRRAGVVLDLPAEAYDDWASEVVENYEGLADDGDGDAGRS
jgi:hypothetical protein